MYGTGTDAHLELNPILVVCFVETKVLLSTKYTEGYGT